MSVVHFDVAVFGGATAGSAIAAAAAGTGLRTVIISRAGDSCDRPGECLSPAARPLLGRLGVWDRFVEDRHLACHANISVWGGDEPYVHSFVGELYGHAWHLDRSRFEHMLRDHARSRGVDVREFRSDLGVRRLTDGWIVRTRDRVGGCGDMRARWLIDATGRASWLARRLGARRRRHDRQVSFVAFLEPTASPIDDSTTLVEAVEDGWWYSALLPDGRLVVSLTTDLDLLPRDRDGAGWLGLLDAAPHTRARVRSGDYRIVDPPAVVDASDGRLDVPAGDGWLAVGDAAMTYDPLAAHGLTAALAGALDAAECLAARGTSSAVERYRKRLDAAYRAYRRARAEILATESRWPGSPFWVRRRGSAGQEARSA